MRRSSQYELRDIFGLSRFIIMPLYNVDFQAGVTAILEAMAMQKPVLCSRTPGHTDVVVEGKNGIYVNPQNPIEMGAASERLLVDDVEASWMGGNARI